MLRWRRRGGTGAVALALAGVLAGCTTGPGSGPDASPPGDSPSATPEGPVTLTLAVYGDDVLRAAYRELADAYTAANPSVTVRVEESRTAERAAEKLHEAMSTSGGPDVFVAANDRVPRFVAEGYIRPLDRLLVERGVPFGDGYERLGLVAFSAERSLQCMPYDVSPLVVFYQPDLVPFEQVADLGEPPVGPEPGWTWEQFAEAAQLASAPGVKGAYVSPELHTLLALVRSAGDELVDDPREATSLTFSDGGTRATLEEVLSVVRDPRVMPTEAQLARADEVTRFKQGRLAMLVGTKALVPELREAEGLDFAVMPLPRLARPRTVAEVTGYCISSSTEHLAATADFVTFATGGRGSRILARTGAVVPAHLPTLNSEAFTEPDGPPDDVEVFTEALAQSSIVPFVPGWAELAESMRPELERMFYDPVLNLEEMLPRLDLASQRLLRPAE